MVLAQQRAGFSQAETSAVVFREQADRGERAEQSIQQCRIGADLRRQRRRGGRAVLGKPVEHAELRASIEDLAAPAAEDQLDDMIGWAGHALVLAVYSSPFRPQKRFSTPRVIPLRSPPGASAPIQLQDRPAESLGQGQTPFTPEQRLIQHDHQAWARALTEPVQRRLRNIDCGHSPKPRLSVAFPRKLTFVDHALAIVTGLPGPAPDGKDREGGQGLP